MRGMIPVFYIIQRELKRPHFWVYIAAAVLMLMLAALSGRASKEDIRKIPIAIVDEDTSEISLLVINRIKDNEFIELKIYDDPMIALMRWEIDGIFVLKDGFGERLINGEKKGLIDFYYPPTFVTSEIIGEAVTKEVMRIYVTYMASDFIRGEYEKRNMDFGEALERETLDYTDSFWELGDTISLDINYVSSGDYSVNKNSALKALMINAALAAALLFIAMTSGIGLEVQKENGVFTRLTLCNVSHVLYAVITTVTPSIACLIALLFIPLTGKSVFALYILWCGLFTAYIAYKVKHTSSFILLLAVLPLLITGLAGFSVYLGGYAVILGMINPVYCVMTGNFNLAAWHVFAALCILGITHTVHALSRKSGYVTKF